MRTTVAVLALLAVAHPAFSQDPVKVDPRHHKVEFENAQVRVLRVTFAPGEKSPAHDHPSLMAIYLTDTQSRISPVGGAVNETPRKRGEVFATAGSKHTVENIGKAPSEVIVVEFKNPPMKGWSAGARDAVTLDSKHYTVVAENDHARALRVRYGPNEKSVMHDHAPNVTVFFSSGKVAMTTPDGKTSEISAARGTVMFSERQTHLPTSGADGAEAIVVELKQAAAARPGN